MKFLSKFFIIFVIVTSSAFANYIVVTSDQIQTTPYGLVVHANGSMIAVESIHTANDGYFVAIPIPNADICPNCRRDGYTPGRFCKYCNFPDEAKIQNAAR